MLDIVLIQDGKDLGLQDSAAPRAANVISTQIGSKQYLPETFGADLKYFLTSDFQFQMQSFQSYVIQRLVFHSINVGEVISTLEPLLERTVFPVGDPETPKGFITQ